MSGTVVVMGSRGAIGWLLTEEGMVDGVINNQRADSKWILRTEWAENHLWNLRIEGKVGAITGWEYPPQFLFYHIETGDFLKLTSESQDASPKTSPEISTIGGSHSHFATPLYLTIP